MNTHSKANQKEVIENESYFCPMHCEGDKTYDQPGDCPVCGMHLVPADDSEGEHKEHSHTKASHDGHTHSHKMEMPAQMDTASGSLKYFCPMHCEGDKTYNKPGDCPVCGMHLVPVGGAEGDHKEHSHAKASHDGHTHTHKMEMPAQTDTASGSGKYYCSMRCEGDKPNVEQGDCPVCASHL